MILRLKRYDLKEDPRKVSEVVTDESGTHEGVVILKPRLIGCSYRYFLISQNLRTGRKRKKKLGRYVFIQGHPDNIINRETYRQRVGVQSLRFNNGKLEAEVTREFAFPRNNKKGKGFIYNRKTHKTIPCTEEPYNAWITVSTNKKVKMRLKRFPYLILRNLRIGNKRGQKKVA